ncbi:uncharacterized protein DSM5745_09815 [Aspergillus mulundensis]|uniref:Uncharacterized protein n=1 Tax=Aspergillus mulundensis TaxID=1810919 RepID=A0A3D8QSD5_9EURO|nr:hypothetical protein DSM5745_09815 [Aspergillus mulundensis]RDW64404.1 hypothetical protein DSM5745_09815 [Aspergillus mulundensis]
MSKNGYKSYILSATVDLETSGTQTGNATKERTCQRKSIELMGEIARYLELPEHGIGAYCIYSGLRTKEQKWQVLILLEKPDKIAMTDEEIRKFRKEIADTFLHGNAPDAAHAVTGLRDFPWRLTASWETKGWAHVSKLAMYNGQHFVLGRDGERWDLVEGRALRKAMNQGESASPGWLSRVSNMLYAIIPTGKGQQRADLTLEEALEKMKQTTSEE